MTCANSPIDSGTLAYVTIGTKSGPVITPVLYGASGTSLWYLSNRKSLKAKILSRRPATTWVVPGSTGTAIYTGQARMLSPLDPLGALAALPTVPAIGAGLASWTVRNPKHALGFIRDTLTAVTRTLPYDQVLTELRPDDVTATDFVYDRGTGVPVVETRLDLGDLPPGMAALINNASGILGVASPDKLLAMPVAWEPSTMTATAPPGLLDNLDGESVSACVTLDEPVHERPTQQRGIVLRGRATVSGGTVRLDVDRITYWDGFETRTLKVTLVPEELSHND
ncbi:hypothetical protein [Smaragdicoccus niigatensis]|uniref:hypothetical protein n=1 Tax=Smaragdicoccus niigatensis TaxID=359359 RepID=UPI00039D9107|nr:hypothetical protein [Smaragdicoccus niigatensis]